MHLIKKLTIFTLIAIILGINAGAETTAAETEKIVELVYQNSLKEKEKLEQRGAYKFKQRIKSTEKDNNGKTTKITKLEYEVNVQSEAEKTTDLLSAHKLENSRWIDISQEVIAKSKDKKTKSASMSLSLANLFGPENRAQYKYELLGQEILATKEVYHLGITALTKDEKTFNGELWFNAGDGSLIKARMVPTKMPLGVKEMSIYLEMARITGLLLPVKTRADVQISFLFFFNGSIMIETDLFDYEFSQEQS